MVHRTMGLPHKSEPKNSYCVIWVKFIFISSIAESGFNVPFNRTGYTFNRIRDPFSLRRCSVSPF